MKKKLLRNASLVALSAVMVCGTAFGLAGCNNKNTNTISISMFCGVDDRAINEAACNTWAEQYTQELIANGRTVEEIRDMIHATSLEYISTEDLVDSVGIPSEDLCMACSCGAYPLEIPNESCCACRRITPAKDD